MADRSLTSPSATLPRIEVSPFQALVDEPVIIRLTGFEAGQRVTLRTGEVIREYPNERPYPEYLFLGYPHGSDDPVMSLWRVTMRLLSLPSMTAIQRCMNRTTEHGGKTNEVCLL